jgi:maleylacetate reductase
VIVRWGLGSLPALLDELAIGRGLAITSARWQTLELPVASRFDGVRRHAEKQTVVAALAAADGADGLVAVGGGSAIDTAKAVSAASGLPVVSVPTTYSGAEWTDFYGTRDPAARVKSGGVGARTVAAVYDPELTLGLPRDESGGTALNALAHCAEALYVPGRSAQTDAEAIAGAPLIDTWLVAVLANGQDLEARRGLLEGAMHAGAALCAGMGVAHAMAQALGGRYGLPHGTMNAVCLPPALRFNAGVAGEAIARFGDALGVDDPASRCEQLAAAFTSPRLRDHGVPREDLPDLAAAAAARPAARGNPRPAGAEAVLELLTGMW